LPPGAVRARLEFERDGRAGQDCTGIEADLAGLTPRLARLFGAFHRESPLFGKLMPEM